MLSFRSLFVDLYLRRFRVPRDMLRFAFRRYRDRTAILAPRGRLTYGQLGERVLSLATAWSRLGVGKGDSVFTLLPDDWEQVEVRLAAYESGAVLTAFHASHPLETIAQAAEMVRPALFIYDPRLGQEVADHFARTMPEVRLLAIGPRSPYETLIASTPARRIPLPLGPDDPAGFGFTSGTTGPPKALVMNQGVGVTSLRLVAKNVGVQPGEIHTFLVGIPLVGAGSGVVLPTLFSGSILVIPERYEAGTFIELIWKFQVTRLFTTPSLLIDLLEEPTFDRMHLPSLRNIIYGTAPTPAAKLEEALQRFGPIFQQGYGMAEVLPPVSLLQMQDHVRNGRLAPRHVLSSVGKVVPEVKVRIVDPEGNVLSPGRVGEILVASPTLFSGYWQRPDLTQRVLKDGWFRTGDHGYFDHEGWLHVLNREADIIQRRGHVIYPRLVEEAVHDFPGVKEACLVAVGEEPTAVLCVSLRQGWREKEGSPHLAEQILRFLETRLHPWQLPDQVHFFPELPRSYLHKVLPRDVRRALTPFPDWARDGFAHLRAEEPTEGPSEAPTQALPPMLPAPELSSGSSRPGRGSQPEPTSSPQEERELWTHHLPL